MGDACDASVVKGSGHNAAFGIAGHYEVKCHDAEGNLKWEDTIENKVVNVGLTVSLNGALTNTAQGATFMSLKGVGTGSDVVAGDTMSSHANWAEITSYTVLVTGSPVAQRPAVTFTAVSAGTTSISAPAQLFTMTNLTNVVVAGCLINVGGAAAFGTLTGTLFSAGNFTGGTKTVINTDTLSVTYTATSTSA